MPVVLLREQSRHCRFSSLFRHRLGPDGVLKPDVESRSLHASHCTHLGHHAMLWHARWSATVSDSTLINHVQMRGAATPYHMGLRSSRRNRCLHSLADSRDQDKTKIDRHESTPQHNLSMQFTPGRPALLWRPVPAINRGCPTQTPPHDRPSVTDLLFARSDPLGPRQPCRQHTRSIVHHGDCTIRYTVCQH
jgi:hypothetical protein